MIFSSPLPSRGDGHAIVFTLTLDKWWTRYSSHAHPQQMIVTIFSSPSPWRVDGHDILLTLSLKRWCARYSPHPHPQGVMGTIFFSPSPSTSDGHNILFTLTLNKWGTRYSRHRYLHVFTLKIQRKLKLDEKYWYESENLQSFIIFRGENSLNQMWNDRKRGRI